jgi:hypothetical protein
MSSSEDEDGDGDEALGVDGQEEALDVDRTQEQAPTQASFPVDNNAEEPKLSRWAASKKKLNDAKAARLRSQQKWLSTAALPVDMGEEGHDQAASDAVTAAMAAHREATVSVPPEDVEQATDQVTDVAVEHRQFS